MTASPPRRAPWLALALSVVATLALFLSAAGTARAGDEAWDCSLGSGKVCAGPRHSLLMSAAWHDSTNRSIGAGASTLGTIDTLYGSLSWATSWACHSYSGNTVLYPLIANGSVIPLTVHGLMSYGSDGAPC